MAELLLAASTLPLPALVLEHDRPVEADLRAGLELVRRCGVSYVDITDTWLPISLLSSDGWADLRDALAACGLKACGISVVRHSILDPADGRANVRHTERAIDGAAALGAKVVSLGFHEPLPPNAESVPFWAIEGRLGPRPDPVPAVRQLADYAESAGVALALELYEGGPLGSGRQAAELVDRVDRSNVGINLDVGNLVRSPMSTGESWADCVRTCLPLANFWHMKNYARLYEHPQGRHIGSIAVGLPDGDIDYRRCLTWAAELGYQGPYVIEHYGGDGLRAQRRGVAYVRELLEEVT